MKHVDIEQRQKKILCAIVESYIEIAMPVGSRAVSQRFRKSISPATIRNVMADLEEKELIMHPYTSAGRIPTDKGYRMYVDLLLEPKHLTKEEESLITRLINRGCEDFETLMQAVSKAICMMTDVAGIVLTPRLKRSVFKQVEFIPIDSSRILAVLITNSGLVKSAILEMEEEFTKSELLRISEFLNHELDGMFLGEIKDYLTRRLLEQGDSFYTFLKKAMYIFSIPGLLKMEDRIYFEGTTSIMACPEFKDIAKARLFLRLFEEKRDLMELFNEDMETDGIKVHIGKENSHKSIQDYTIITSNYKINDRVMGAIGAIGPTRMEYGRVMSAVSYLSSILGKVMEELG
ncbi:MAG: heat-inducible transcriptional repressor HrcA [Candidatus Omnitrophica bacterium]|nr:heat-inducible transcriptional repressor HrcA [Candidatus Omnitrophota bacterium]MBU1932964.1 heat-inducible transcriptional repressor HrcA [Candidatus Omnitrophota bacterium]